MWMSPLEILKLSIGLADFTCCQRNHSITTETQKIMNGGQVKKIPCDKPIAGGILEQLIDAKINHLFNAEGDMVMARLHIMFRHWWMRELKEKKKISSDDKESAVEKFKKRLRWNEDELWFDQSGICLLLYAVGTNEEHVVKELLEELKQNFDEEEYNRRLESRVRKEGYASLGVPGESTTLMAAMMLSSPRIIELLIEYGADPTCTDVWGADCMMYAASYNRPDNIKVWLSQFPAWKLSLSLIHI